MTAIAHTFHCVCVCVHAKAFSFVQLSQMYFSICTDGFARANYCCNKCLWRLKDSITIDGICILAQI